MKAFKAEVYLSDGYDIHWSMTRYFKSKNRADSWAKSKQEDYDLQHPEDGGSSYFVEQIEVEE